MKKLLLATLVPIWISGCVYTDPLCDPSKLVDVKGLEGYYTLVKENGEEQKDIKIERRSKGVYAWSSASGLFDEKESLHNVCRIGEKALIAEVQPEKKGDSLTFYYVEKMGKPFVWSLVEFNEAKLKERGYPYRTIKLEYGEIIELDNSKLKPEEVIDVSFPSTELRIKQLTALDLAFIEP